MREGKVLYEWKKDGKVVLEPATLDVKELEGILCRAGLKSLSTDEMNAVIKKSAAKKVNDRSLKNNPHFKVLI